MAFLVAAGVGAVALALRLARRRRRAHEEELDEWDADEVFFAEEDEFTFSADAGFQAGLHASPRMGVPANSVERPFGQEHRAREADLPDAGAADEDDSVSSSEARRRAASVLKVCDWDDSAAADWAEGSIDGEVPPVQRAAAAAAAADSASAAAAATAVHGASHPPHSDLEPQPPLPGPESTLGHCGGSRGTAAASQLSATGSGSVSRSSASASVQEPSRGTTGTSSSSPAASQSTDAVPASSDSEGRAVNGSAKLAAGCVSGGGADARACQPAHKAEAAAAASGAEVVLAAAAAGQAAAMAAAASAASATVIAANFVALPLRAAAPAVVARPAPEKPRPVLAPVAASPPSPSKLLGAMSPSPLATRLPDPQRIRQLQEQVEALRRQHTHVHAQQHAHSLLWSPAGSRGAPLPHQSGDESSGSQSDHRPRSPPADPPGCGPQLTYIPASRRGRPSVALYGSDDSLVNLLHRPALAQHASDAEEDAPAAQRGSQPAHQPAAAAAAPVQAASRMAPPSAAHPAAAAAEEAAEARLGGQSGGAAAAPREKEESAPSPRRANRGVTEDGYRRGTSRLRSASSVRFATDIEDAEHDPPAPRKQSPEPPHSILRPSSPPAVSPAAAAPGWAAAATEAARAPTVRPSRLSSCSSATPPQLTLQAQGAAAGQQQQQQQLIQLAQQQQQEQGAREAVVIAELQRQIAELRRELGQPQADTRPAQQQQHHHQQGAAGVGTHQFVAVPSPAHQAPQTAFAHQSHVLLSPSAMAALQPPSLLGRAHQPALHAGPQPSWPPQSQQQPTGLAPHASAAPHHHTHQQHALPQGSPHPPASSPQRHPIGASRLARAAGDADEDAEAVGANLSFRQHLEHAEPSVSAARTSEWVATNGANPATGSDHEQQQQEQQQQHARSLPPNMRGPSLRLTPLDVGGGSGQLAPSPGPMASPAASAWPTTPGAASTDAPGSSVAPTPSTVATALPPRLAASPSMRQASMQRSPSMQRSGSMQRSPSLTRSGRSPSMRRAPSTRERGMNDDSESDSAHASSSRARVSRSRSKREKKKEKEELALIQHKLANQAPPSPLALFGARLLHDAGEKLMPAPRMPSGRAFFVPLRPGLRHELEEKNSSAVSDSIDDQGSTRSFATGSVAATPAGSVTAVARRR